MTKRTRTETLALTDLVLEAIRVKPMHHSNLVDMFNLGKSDINNMLCRLKKQGLIKVHPDDLDNPSNKKRWTRTNITQTYFQIVKQNQRRAELLAASKCKGEVTFSPLANSAMCKTSADYHTSGNKSRVPAWSGYGGYFDN